MATVEVARTDDGKFYGRNDRGARVDVGGPDDEGSFTPVELLLVALGGCEIVTVEPLTAQRGHRLVRLAVKVEAEKTAPTKLGTATVTYEIELPDTEGAAKVFQSVARRVHEHHCTVGRALREETQVEQVLPAED